MTWVYIGRTGEGGGYEGYIFQWPHNLNAYKSYRVSLFEGNIEMQRLL